MVTYNPDGTAAAFDTLEDPRTILSNMAYAHAKRRDAVEGGGVMRGGLPQWGPGEFEEWKNAKMTGTPTKYGAAKQRLYQASRVGPQYGAMTARSGLAGLTRSANQNQTLGIPATPEYLHQLQSLTKAYGGR